MKPEWQALTAPQYGLWSSLPPVTDNPARYDKPVPPPPEIATKMIALRAEFAERAKQWRERERRVH